VFLCVAAKEAEKLRLEIRVRRWGQLGSEDTGLTDHGVHGLQSLVGLPDRVLVEALVRAHGVSQVPGVHEHIHGHEAVDDLTGGHLPGWPVQLLSERIGILGDVGHLSRCFSPGLGGVFVGTHGRRFATPDIRDDATVALDHMGNHVAGIPPLAGGLGVPAVGRYCVHRGIEATRYESVSVLYVGHGRIVGEARSPRRLTVRPVNRYTRQHG
jgi:hypothetical protein